MRIGLVGSSYEQRSLPFDAQRTINLFPVLDEQGKETASLYGTPGLLSFAEAGAGPVRGGIKSGNGRVFFVSGAGLYEVSASGVVTSRGSLLTSEGTVSMAEGTTQLAICDGTKLYALTYASNVFGVVTDPDLPASVGIVANIDGYFVVNVNGAGQFYISAIDDTTDWHPLDYATAESAPDKLTCPVSAVGMLWLLGEKTTEVWSNTGNSLFPFSRMSGGTIGTGVLAPHSVLEIDNGLLWLGQDEFGAGMVYRASGFTPVRISTEPIEKRISEASAPEEILAWAYQEEGHLHYVLTGGGLETSLVLDLTTQQWHERAYLNDDGLLEPHLGSCHVFAFGKHLVGSRVDGKIYSMSLDYYSDNGAEIARERVYTHISNENQRQRYNALEIGFETGVGLQSGQGSDPVVTLYISKDGARTWSRGAMGAIGKVGEYMKTVAFRRLGVAEILTFKIRITDPVKVAITGSYLK